MDGEYSLRGKKPLRWVTWKMVFLPLGGKMEGWRVDLLWLGVSKGSVALEENVLTSGELEGARRKGWNGEEGGSGRRCTSLSLLSTIRSEGAGRVYNLRRCTAVPR